MIEVGQPIPSVTIKNSDGDVVDPSELFKGKRVVMFSLPGAFTPTCSKQHLPGYVAQAAKLHEQGAELIACLSVNDADVMRAWALEQGVDDKIVMLADGAAAFTKALGIETDIPHMGTRARRGLFVIDDGVVSRVSMEAPREFKVSGADVCSTFLLGE